MMTKLRKSIVWILMPALVLAACDGDAESPLAHPNDAGSQIAFDSATQESQDGALPGDSGTSTTSDLACGVTKFCGDLTTQDLTAQTRVAVIWVGPATAGTVQETAYDTAVGATTTVAIEVSAVVAPKNDKLLVCDRAGKNDGPCVSDPKVSYGFVVLYEDDGDATFTTADRAIGFGSGLLGYAPVGFAAGAAPTNPKVWDETWPDGVKTGAAVYRLEAGNKSHVVPRTSSAGALYSFVVDPPGIF